MRILLLLTCFLSFAACGSSNSSNIEDAVPFVGLTPGQGLFTTYDASQLTMGNYSGQIADVRLSNQDLICGDANNVQYGGDTKFLFINFASYATANPNLFFYKAGTFSCPNNGRVIDGSGEGHTAGITALANGVLATCVSGTITISDLSPTQLTVAYDVAMDTNDIYEGKVSVPYCAAP